MCLYDFSNLTQIQVSTHTHTLCDTHANAGGLATGTYAAFVNLLVTHARECKHACCAYRWVSKRVDHFGMTTLMTRVLCASLHVNSVLDKYTRHVATNQR